MPRKESVQLPDECYVILIKYLEVSDIITRLMVCNKRLRDLLISENYLLFKHFLRSFNLLNDRLKKSEIPAKISIMALMRDNFSLRRAHPVPQNLRPYAFYTDGGAYNDDNTYFIQNIFSQSHQCYSSLSP